MLGLLGCERKERGAIESNARVGFVGAGKVRHGARWAFEARHCGFWIQFAAGRRRRRQLRKRRPMRMRQKLLRRPTLFSSRYPMARFNAWKSLVASYVAPRRAMRCSGKSYAIARARFPAAAVLAADAEEYGAKAASVHPLFAISGGKRSGENRLCVSRLRGRRVGSCTVSALLDVCGVHHRKSLRAISRFTTRRPCARVIWL